MNLRLVSQIVISLCQFTVLKYWLCSFASDRLRTKEAGIAELEERLTEKPGAILARVRVPGAARDFSPRASFPVQSHASTSGYTLEIRTTGSHSIV